MAELNDIDIAEAKRDYWRAMMYKDIREFVFTDEMTGTGIEFGGSNGIIQSCLPNIRWENRDYPAYDITKEESHNECDVIIADQILEHVFEPWKAFENIGNHAKKAAIITLPFLIGLHPCPGDYWRITPQSIYQMAQYHFKRIYIKSWGNSRVNYWHSIYDRTDTMMSNISEPVWRDALLENDIYKPFVIWAILEK